MLKISEDLIAFLATQVVFTSIMGTKIYPIVAPEKTPFPFTTYRIVSSGPLSCDGKTRAVELYFWFGPNKYKECIGFTDLMELIIEENYEWQSSSPDFSDEDFGYVGIINFNIN